MLKTFSIDITAESISETYKIEAEDSYDAKIRAVKQFFFDFGFPARLADVENCIEV